MAEPATWLNFNGHPDIPLSSMLPPPNQRLPHIHLSLDTLPRRARFPQWRKWMEHMVDVTILEPEQKEWFNGSLKLYAAGDIVVSHCHSDAMRIHRGLDRISRDGMAHYAFHILLDGGHGRIMFKGRETLTRTGDILLLDFDQASTIERTSYTALALFVPRLILLPYLDLIGQPVRIAPRDSAYTAMVYQWAHSLLQHLPDLDQSAANQAIAGFLPMLAGCFAQEVNEAVPLPQRNALCRQAAHYIATHRDDPELSVAGVAQHFGLSRSQLYRLFASSGESPAALIRRYRLKAAVNDILHRPGMPIAQIAYVAGFGTPASFSSAFRQAYGLSPQQLRKAHASRRITSSREAIQPLHPYAEIFNPSAR